MAGGEGSSVLYSVLYFVYENPYIIIFSLLFEIITKHILKPCATVKHTFG